jgi:hypothetical protein
MVQKAVNRKHAFVVTGLFRFKPVNSGMSQIQALFIIQ